jgi:hypothetical protein
MVDHLNRVHWVDEEGIVEAETRDLADILDESRVLPTGLDRSRLQP